MPTDVVTFVPVSPLHVVRCPAGYTPKPLAWLLPRASTSSQLRLSSLFRLKTPNASPSGCDFAEMQALSPCGSFTTYVLLSVSCAPNVRALLATFTSALAWRAEGIDEEAACQPSPS